MPGSSSSAAFQVGGEFGVSGRSGRSLDDLRRSNLSSVLRVVHLSNGCTRAEITHETSLNRSTVRALVSELVGVGILIEEKAEKSGGMGRPSPSVSASDRVRVLAVNPEVDVTTGTVVGLGGRIFARAEVRHRSSPRPSDVVAAVNDLIDELDPDKTLWGIGVAIPGLVNEATGAVAVAPHLGWRDVPLAALLSEAHGLRVVVGNDATCGALAESLFGAGRGSDAMVYLNGGASGIGGASIIGGSVMAGSDGYAGEFGHTLVNTVGSRCDCGATGCLETEVRRAPLLTALDEITPAELDNELLRQGALGGPAAIEADRQLRFLGIALRTVVNVMNPRRILLGGFLASMVHARGFTIIHDELSHALPGGSSAVEIVTAELGSNILAVGAAQLVLRHIIDDPLGAHELARTA